MIKKIIIKSHRIKLNPTPDQEAYFWQCAGIARSAWNWALGEYNRRKAEGQKVKIIGNGQTLKSEFTALKKTDRPYLNDVQSYAYQRAFSDLQKAISRYFKFKKEGNLRPPKGWKPRKDGKPFGWPRFKSRNKATPSFYLANNGGFKFSDDDSRVGDYCVRIQKCPGLVNMAESLRFKGKKMGARISYRHGQWWLSVQVEMEIELPEPSADVVGVDLGIKYLAVTSDPVVIQGEEVTEFQNPRALKKAQRKLRRLQRKLDRQRRANNPDNYNENGTVKQSATEWVESTNMKKTRAAIQKLHYRVRCIRNEASHQMTTAIARNYGVVGVEDLNIKGIQKNRRIAKAISDAALYEKRRQLEYKADWNGGIVVPVNRWFPSSKTCNGCGWIKADLRLSDRQWTCQECGQVNHRDSNAALNIRDEAIKILNTSPGYSDGDEKRLNANSGNSRIVEEP